MATQRFDPSDADRQADEVTPRATNELTPEERALEHETEGGRHAGGEATEAGKKVFLDRRVICGGCMAPPIIPVPEPPCIGPDYVPKKPKRRRKPPEATEEAEEGLFGRKKVICGLVVWTGSTETSASSTEDTSSTDTASPEDTGASREGPSGEVGDDQLHKARPIRPPIVRR